MSATHHRRPHTTLRTRASLRVRLGGVLVAAVATVAAGMAAPVPASATTPATGSDGAELTPAADDEAAGLAASAKVTSEVRDQLSDGSRTDFWLRLGDRPDLSEAATIADWADRGEAVVDTLKAAAEASQADVIAALDDAGVDYDAFWVTNAVLVHDGTAALAARLAARSDVEQISEVTYLSLEDPPDPTQADSAEPAAATGVAWGVEEIGAPSAWAQGYTGEGITVANLDTGVDADHPALWRSFAGSDTDASLSTDYTWFDVVDVCEDGLPCDTGHHGSHTMGTMVGDDLADHQIGVAPGAQWIATNPLGDGAASNATMLAAAQWTLAPTRSDGSDPDPGRRPHIVNNSWGGSTTNDDWFDDMLAAWDAAGVFAVFANGNSGPYCSTAGSPGRREAAYSVGAYDDTGAIAPFSSRGAGDGDVIKPDISAPGVAVPSANGEGGYYQENGTSMASPHVAGAVALLWNAEPALVGEVERTRELLDATARDVDDTTCGGTAANNNVWGEGKLSVPALIDAAQADVVTGHLDVAVTSPDGDPVADARVRIAEAGQSGTTDENGRVRLPLHAGPRTVDVEVAAFSFSTRTTTVAVPESGDTTATVSLDEPALHTVSGTVTETSLDHPIADATVQLTSADGVTATITTGPDGSYRIDGVPAGTHTLRADAIAVLAPNTTTIDVTGDTVVDPALVNATDGGRYSAVPGTGPYQEGDTPLDIEPTGLTPWSCRSTSPSTAASIARPTWRPADT